MFNRPLTEVSLEKLRLPSSTFDALDLLGVRTVADLVSLTEDEVASMATITKPMLIELRRKLSKALLQFGMRPPGAVKPDVELMRRLAAAARKAACAEPDVPDHVTVAVLAPAAHAPPPVLSVGASLSDTLLQVDAWLGANLPHVVLEPPAADSDIDQLHAKLRLQGYPADADLPAEVVTLLRWHNGHNPRYIRNDDRIFCCLDGGILHSATQVASSHEILMANAKIAAAEENAPGYFHRGWLPLFQNDYSVTCYDALGSFGTRPGSLVHVDFKGGQSRPFIAPSLAAWFSVLLEVWRDPQAARAWLADSNDHDDYDELQAYCELAIERIARALLPNHPVTHDVSEVADLETHTAVARRISGAGTGLRPKSRKRDS